jgi:hypothetical protein
MNFLDDVRKRLFGLEEIKRIRELQKERLAAMKEITIEPEEIEEEINEALSSSEHKKSGKRNVH